MHIRNMEGLLLLSLKNKDLPKIKSLVRKLKLNGEHVEIRDCLEEHDDQDIFPIVSEDNEHIIVVLGTKKFHLILPKVGNFEEFKEKVIETLETNK